MTAKFDLWRFKMHINPEVPSPIYQENNLDNELKFICSEIFAVTLQGVASFRKQIRSGRYELKKRRFTRIIQANLGFIGWK